MRRFPLTEIGGRPKGKDITQTFITHPGCEPITQLLQFLCRCDYHRETRVVSMIDELRELIDCPSSRGLCPEVVEDEKRRILDLAEAFVVRDRALRREGGTKMIEQIGDSYKEARPTHCNTLIGNGSREVGLAAAMHSQQNKPALRILGELASLFQCLAEIPLLGF